MKKHLLVLPIVAALGVALWGSGDTLVISRVGGDIHVRENSLRPVADYIVKQLPRTGFARAQVQYASDPESLLEYARTGEVHWVSESVYVAALLAHEGEMRPVLNRHKNGQQRYGSVLVAERSIESLPQLISHRVAMEDPGSFSGYFLVYRHLVEQGLPLNTLTSVQDAPDPQRINLIFSGDSATSQTWFQQGLVEAVTLSNHAYRRSPLIAAELSEQAHALWASEQYPRAIELVSKQIDPATRGAIEALLLSLHPGQDSKLAGVLDNYDKTTGFTALTDHDLKQLQGVYRFVEQDRLRLSAAQSGAE